MRINKEDLLDAVKLKELLDYDPDTGIFTWRERVGDSRSIKIFNTKFAGKIAGSIYHQKDRHDGFCYIRVGISFNKKSYQYYMHRLAWLYMTGEWPENQIDHINHIGTDNRWVNLRDTDENPMNRGMQGNNTSGFTGVSWHKYGKKWQAEMQVGGEHIHIGYFTNKQQAIDARKSANIEYGFHENHGNKNNA